MLNSSEYLETPHPTVTHRTTRIFKYTFSPYGDDGSRGVFPLSMFGIRSSSFLLLQLDVGLGLDKTSSFMLVLTFKEEDNRPRMPVTM